MDLSTTLATNREAVTIRVKVVPGARRTKIAGILGGRLKVTVAAPPEGGKANRQLCDHLARILGVSKRDVNVASGRTRTSKTVQVSGVSLQTISERLSRVL